MNEEPRPAILMSLSCSTDYDLLCAEDTSGILTGDSPEFSSDLDSSSPSPSSLTEESIAGFIEHERNFVPGFEYLSRFKSHSLDAIAREESVAWILKVHAYYGFQPLTAYLSVNYMDRFLDSRRLPVSSRFWEALKRYVKFQKLKNPKRELEIIWERLAKLKIK